MKTAKTTNLFNRNIHYVRSLGLGYRVVEVEGFNQVSLLDAEGKLIDTGMLAIKRSEGGKYYIGSPSRARAFDVKVSVFCNDHINIHIGNNANIPGIANCDVIGLPELISALHDMALKYFEIGEHQIIERKDKQIQVRGYLQLKFFDIYQDNEDKWRARLNNRVVMYGRYSDDATFSTMNNDDTYGAMCRVDTLTPQETAIKMHAMAVRSTREQLVVSKELEIAHEALDGALSDEYMDMLITDVNKFEVVEYEDVTLEFSRNPILIYGTFAIYAPKNGLPTSVILRNESAGDMLAFTTDNWILVPRRALPECSMVVIRGYINNLAQALKRMKS